MIAKWKMASPVGTLYFVATDGGVSGLYFREPTAMDGAWLDALEGEGAAKAHLRRLVAELEEYFAGKRTTFEVPLDVAGTPFQRRVWDELAKIPYGEVVSYRDVARRLGAERAVRAVGGANGKNPVSIVVPCHRVIAANGTLGGYGGGLPAKEKLLTLEGAQLSKGVVDLLRGSQKVDDPF